MEKKELHVGDVVEINDKKYKLKKGTSLCDGCVFLNKYRACDIQPLLLKEENGITCKVDDLADVIFVEEPQEPFEVVAEITMPDKADVPIGKGVKINGRTYACEESISGCRLCALRSTSACEAVQCACYDRADGKEVIFTEVLDKPADKPSLTNKFEYTVGEIFERDGVKYQCVVEEETECCTDCAFGGSICLEYVCQSRFRKDRTPVLFKKVSDEKPEPEKTKREIDVIETAAKKINSFAEEGCKYAFDRISELAGEIIKMCGDFKKE